ncbi:PEP-CTERM sorting domain-containing protein [Niveibacterium umoris]|uniref:Ice-binding protein C-terminal domain-containing protein n=1 Tax=Niveibacterium umoris TaxID=1193620 RepID=A0A840BIM6_9RHOO|nr:PEP-CTERM sorting domain-containing protein [Niveibacterium umoris]MBB4013075.1 hypothetical protein [Niveibacterium umoris]
MPLLRLLAIATIAIAFTNSAVADMTHIAVSPTTALRQADGSYVLGGLSLAPGQWRIQEAPSGPSACCDGYRLVSDANYQTATLTLRDKDLSLSSFEAVVQFNDEPNRINDIWGWVNAYSAGSLVSSSYFFGHYWSQPTDRQTVAATLPSPADRIEFVTRTNLAYTAFSYSVSAVPEPSTAVLLSFGVAVLGLFSGGRRLRYGAANV